MNEEKLNVLLESRPVLNRRIAFYLRKNILRMQPLIEAEVKGHAEKSKHNLDFVASTFSQGYLDWVITGCYYAAYHAALSLILSKGYSSKNHDATLCVLIKEFYKKGIEKADIELINTFFLDYQDLLFYVESKNKREEATYSSKYVFDRKTVEELIGRTRLFVGKAAEILENMAPKTHEKKQDTKPSGKG